MDTAMWMIGVVGLILGVFFTSLQLFAKTYKTAMTMWFSSVLFLWIGGTILLVQAVVLGF